jgi:hypothetical protein
MKTIQIRYDPEEHPYLAKWHDERAFGELNKQALNLLEIGLSVLRNDRTLSDKDLELIEDLLQRYQTRITQPPQQPLTTPVADQLQGLLAASGDWE